MTRKTTQGKTGQNRTSMFQELGGIRATKPATNYSPDKQTKSLQRPRQIFDITPQETNVALLVAQGKTNSEIAAALFLTPGTVRNYVSSILSKLYLSNRAALAVYVVQHDLNQTPGTDQAAPVSNPDCYKDLLFLAYV